MSALDESWAVVLLFMAHVWLGNTAPDTLISDQLRQEAGLARAANANATRVASPLANVKNS